MKTATISNDNDNDPVASILESVKKEQEQYLKDMLPKIKHYYDTMGLCVLPQYPGQKRPAVYLWKEEAIPKRPSWKKTQELFKNAFQLCINEIDKVKKLAEEDPAKYADVYKVAKERGWKWGLGALTGHRSGVVVVDWDSPEARVEWLKRNPDTPWKTKTNKGGHGYYINDDKYQIKTNGGHFFEGTDPSACFDIRGHGGFIVLPGGIHKSGYVYQQDGVWNQEMAIKVPVFNPAWIPPRPEEESENKPKTTQTQVFDKAPTQSQHGKEKSDLDKFMFHEYMKRACPEFTQKTIEGCMGYTSFCPCESEHKNVNADTDFGIWQNAEGEICTKCMHTSCGTWSFSRFHSIYPIKSEDFSDHGQGYNASDIDSLTQINVPMSEYDWSDNNIILRNPFPTKCLPPNMKTYVEALSYHRTADKGFTATGLLVAVSAYLNNVCVAVDNDWVIPPTLYALTIAPPAQQKGVSTNHIYETVEMWENKKTFEREEKLKECDKKKESIKKQIESNNNAIRQYQRQLSSSKVTEIEKETLQHQVKVLQDTNTALETSMDELYAWFLPRGFLLQESTVQWMLHLMKRSNHRGLLFSTEATPLKRAVLGRGGADDSSVDRWKDMWDGKTCTYGSIAQGDTLTVTRAALSAYLCIQPDLMKKIMKHDEFGGGGLGSRFLVTYRDDDAVVGSNSTVPTEILEWVNSLIYNLAYIPVQWDDENKRPEPRRIQFSQEASETLHELEIGLVETVNKMRSNGGNSHQQAVLRRLKPQVMKIALILHFVRHLKLKTPDVFDSPWNMLDYSDSPFCHEIGDEDTQNAIKLVSWYYREWQRWMANPNRECEQVARIIWKWLLSRKKNDWITINAFVSKGPLRYYTPTTVKMGESVGKHELANDALLYLINNEDRPIEIEKSRKGGAKIRLKSKH